MQDHINSINYIKYLKAIKDIPFTPREIDIMACLLSGKKAGVIAAFLDVSPRTIETHMFNIRTKLGCSSSDGIIQFLEKSKELPLLKKHYQHLLIEDTFKQALLKICKTVNNGSYSNLIIFDKKQDKSSSILYQIEKYLMFAGIRLLYEIKDIKTFFSDTPHNLELKHIENIIYALNTKVLKELNINDKIVRLKDNLSKSSINKHSIIFLMLEGENIPQAIRDSTLIDFRKTENFYIVILDLIQKLLGNIDLSKIIKEFREEYESILKASERIIIQIEPKQEKEANSIKRKSLNFWLYFFSTRKSRLIAGSIIALFIIFSSFWLLIGREKFKYIIQFSESIQTTLISPWNTPYLPAHFVNRIELRNKILAELQNNDQKLNQAILLGLHGLGGVGKTYLALNMIYNPAKNYSFRGWITANDEDKIKQDYIKMGNELGLLTEDMSEDQKIAKVKSWLNSQKSLFLVFDNCPNMEILEQYLPQKGDIIITSRNYNIPSAIGVDGMEEGEALELLRNLISDSSCQDKCATLVRKLGYLPLAIAQAGAYIKQNKITIDKYLQLYKEEQAALMSSDVMPSTDKHAPVYITWNLSLKEIKEKDKNDRALELLNLISFCHFVDIPKILLTEYLYGNAGSKTEIKLNETINILRQYSLIKVTCSTVAIHHLLQDCIRSGIKPQEQRKILKKAIGTIKRICPLESYQVHNYELIKILLPQMENLLIHTRSCLSQIDTAEFIIYIAEAYRKLGDYCKPKSLLEEAINIQEKYYGTRKRIELAFPLRRLGKTYLSLGDNNKAKALLEEALAIEKSYYRSRNHIEIALTLRCLGMVYLSLGDYNTSKKVLEEALTIQENCYGTRKYIGITPTLRRLGKVYLRLGYYNKAITLLEEALAIQESYYDTNKHIELTFILRDLGRVHLNLKNYDKSKTYLEKALAIQENYYGTRKHIDIANILTDLGGAYLNLKAYNKAKALLEEALAVQENYYGNRKQIDTTFILIQLGETYSSLGDNSKAKTFLKDAIAIQENYYGSHHPEVANSLISLAQIEYLTGNIKYALSLLERAVSILQNYSNLNSKHNYIKKAYNLKQSIIKSRKIN